ncbi:MAG TPA: ABC transporter ATP-binding protein [Actinotalea sp.]|nr:ABC transporter ATP-binding protein [Actinotalea sp.]
MTAGVPARAATRVGDEPALLEVRSLTKRFGEVVANSDVDLTVLPGEVHALIGENGAGKSTLLKMIYGVYLPDEGRMFVDGAPVSPRNAAAARGLGIGMVFQDLRLVPALTVAENIALALPGGPRLRLDALVERISAAATTYGLAVDPRSTVRHLSIGERQRAEILKVLMSGARLVILDEPTSVLAPQEVEALFAVVAQLRDQGLGVVIVTHKLGEVRAIADRVTVLRGGRVILNGVDPSGYTDPELIEAMVGRRVPPLSRERVAVPQGGHPVLELQGASALGDRGHVALKTVDLTVHPGELVGVAGVAGSGQKELCEVAMGLRPLSSGSVRVSETTSLSPRAAGAAGVVGIPEDPVADSVVPGLTVLEHMVLDGRAAPRRGVGIDWPAVRSRTAAMDERVGLRMAPAHRRLGSLSGGNIQRVLLTRELGQDAALVVAAYPSRGLDVANTRRTQEVLLEHRARGAGVLMVSEDLDELIAVADRIAVMHDGHVVGVVEAAGTDRMALGRLMLGGAA